AAVRECSEPIDVAPGVRPDQAGDHFPGSTIANWADGANGAGELIAGDAIIPVAHGNATLLRSYPNPIPLSAAVVRRMADHVAGYEFAVLYNNFGASIDRDARRVVQFSARRYIEWVSGTYDHLT